MAKATIKSTSGSVITVQGTHEEIARIVRLLEGSDATVLPVEKSKKDTAPTARSRKDQKKRVAALDLVTGLKEEGFFDKPKGLSEIAHSLEEMGYVYPVTTLSGVMLGLVQKKRLGRKKFEGKWVYGK